jgi:hypothetical protein
VKRALFAVAAALLVWAASAGAVVIDWSASGTSLVPGWYVSDVWVNWKLTNINGTLTSACNPVVHVTAETTGQQLTCSATDDSGTTSRTTSPIRIDLTPPVVAVGPDRAADVSGFYNHPLTVTWSGTDKTSGIASCTSLPYGGPDGSSLSLGGTCTDKAGNVSAPVPFGFNYDATPPALANLAANAEDRSVILSWQSAGATRITVTRIAGGARAAQVEVVYDGTGSNFTDTGLTNGARYTYTVRAVDAAANAATASINVTPSAAAASQPLLSPPPQAKVKRPPLLRWRPVWKASYYNLQIFRKGKKILSVWPRKAHYQLRSEWRYRGHKQRLGKATYRWYIWPGYGRRNQHRYGKLLGRRSFTIT